MPPARRLSDLFDSLPDVVRAGVWITLSGAGFTGMMAIARILAPDLHILMIVFYRSLFGVAFLMPLLLRSGPSLLRTGKTPAYILRGIFAFTGLTCYFYAAALLPLADIAALTFTRPLFTTIVAIVILGEIARSGRWWGIAVGFIGALIVIRPGFQEMNTGLWFVLGAVVLQTLTPVVTRFLAYTEHPDAIAIYQGIYFAPLALISAAFVWQTPDLEQFLWLIGLGAIGALTQRALSRAYVAADATVVVALDFLRLPVAAVIGLVVFAEFPDVWVWTGGAVIIGAAVLLTRGEARGEAKGG